MWRIRARVNGLIAYLINSYLIPSSTTHALSLCVTGSNHRSGAILLFYHGLTTGITCCSMCCLVCGELYLKDPLLLMTQCSLSEGRTLKKIYIFTDAFSTFCLRLYGVGHYGKGILRVFLYALSHRQDSTYRVLCYISCGLLVGTRNSSVDPHVLK